MKMVLAQACNKKESDSLERRKLEDDSLLRPGSIQQHIQYGKADEGDTDARESRHEKSPVIADIELCEGQTQRDEHQGLVGEDRPQNRRKRPIEIVRSSRRPACIRQGHMKDYDRDDGRGPQ